MNARRPRPRKSSATEPGRRSKGVPSSPGRTPPRPTRVLEISGRQRRFSIDRRALREILVAALLEEMDVVEFELGVHLVGAEEMTAVNETFLQHEGSTDVITFNHAEQPARGVLHGELFVCVDEAQALAPRFKTTWPDEVLRYCVHGFLHLLGHDDLEPSLRRRMKREENRIMRTLRKRFAVTEIARNIRAAT
ncbi:MAG TPA: rRNA maturation RNase YbeY [Verrucomicrobiales bacterium]|nr:rRNA maturation RNase YbeY [Verrucomicrobiales bacterium]